MYRHSLGLVLGLCSFEARAQGVHQWVGSTYSMYDYINQGYELRAYSDNTPSTASAPAFGHFQVVYFLQKEKELVRCIEYQPNARSATPQPSPFCSTLTKPK